MRKKLLSPAGFAFCLICFSLPFLAVSCQSPIGTVSADYSGWDFVFGGQPDVTSSFVGREPPTPDTRTAIGIQFLALLAFLTVVAGIVAALIPRLRAQQVASLVTSAMALVFLVANQVMVRDQVLGGLQDSSGRLFARQAANMISTRYGFWLATVALLAVAGYNAYELFRHRISAPGSTNRSGPAGPFHS